ncbi:methyladenine glycosylase [Bacteriovorax sp. BAL6_X]|uniref:DNA-3-methyladenine glycosylase I n=1 Tax=Bacteriovorax sp. BAL6_X TaxID=1201290 RepID=UPI000385E903|nr:DNA-3-methyladenine glycosylase I [Bacteriovorax sp. BAL6_X]EPZ49353.1 methyladenine glycosylase [Bacteriovorax sp. BAL6_X]
MKERCAWLKLSNKQYVDYHDKEWGRPVHDDRTLFEFLILEGAQAGLSWETVLNKRDHYRKVFYNFDVKKVSKITPAKIEKLLLDPGIIRNRLKVESTVSNAKYFIEIQKEFGSFDKYIWSFTNGKTIYNTFATLKDYPSKTELSDKISKDLKKRGFRFVGSTIIYAFLQACGIVQDHSPNCYLHGKKLVNRSYK